MEETDADAYLEVGPEATLVKMGKRCVVGKALKDWPWLHSMEPDESEASSVAGALVTLQDRS